MRRRLRAWWKRLRDNARALWSRWFSRERSSPERDALEPPPRPSLLPPADLPVEPSATEHGAATSDSDPDDSIVQPIVDAEFEELLAQPGSQPETGSDSEAELDSVSDLESESEREPTSNATPSPASLGPGAAANLDFNTGTTLRFSDTKQRRRGRTPSLNLRERSAPSADPEPPSPGLGGTLEPVTPPDAPMTNEAEAAPGAPAADDATVVKAASVVPAADDATVVEPAPVVPAADDAAVLEAASGAPTGDDATVSEAAPDESATDDTPMLETVSGAPTVDDAKILEAAPVVPAADDATVAETAPGAPMTDDVPALETTSGAPAVDDAPVVESARVVPAADDAAVSEAAPDESATGDAPVVETVSGAPTVDDAPILEPARVAPTTDDAPVLESVVESAAVVPTVDDAAAAETAPDESAIVEARDDELGADNAATAEPSADAEDRPEHADAAELGLPPPFEIKEPAEPAAHRISADDEPEEAADLEASAAALGIGVPQPASPELESNDATQIASEREAEAQAPVRTPDRRSLLAEHELNCYRRLLESQAKRPSRDPESLDVPKDYVPMVESRDTLFQLHLAGFEGPLDLLLFLIRRHKIEIFDIPIGFICAEYLRYIRMMEDLDIDVASEFLFMASELLHIKSKMLLPKPAEVDEEEDIDPRAELVARLLEYQKYKRAAAELNQVPWLGRDRFPRSPEPLPAPEGVAPLKEVGVFALIEAFNRVLERQKPEVRHQVLLEQVSVRQRIKQLIQELRGEESTPFESMLVGLSERLDVIVTFLAVLEMAKRQLLRVYVSEGDHLYVRARFDDIDTAMGQLDGLDEEEYA